MSVLILSVYLDYHAEAVLWGLQLSGANALKWVISEFPAEQGLSMRLSNETVRMSANDWSKDATGIVGEGSIHDNFDVVWHRRVGRPQISRGTKQTDRAFIESESEHAKRGIIRNMQPDALWVNRPSASYEFDNKISQLLLAKKVGLTIPETIVSNDAGEICEFFAGRGKIIYKAFNTPRWIDKKNDVTYATMTTLVTVSDIMALKESLAVCPGIFQSYIDKEFEIRVTVMGEDCLAVKLCSQDSDSSKIDWRFGIQNCLIEEVELPKDVASKIYEFMKQSGLAFGCIDMVVRPDGTYVFLEVNTAGQFLWIEAFNPEIRVLSRFCNFLLSGSNETILTDPNIVNFEAFSTTPQALDITGRGRYKIDKYKANFQHISIHQY